MKAAEGGPILDLRSSSRYRRQNIVHLGLWKYLDGRGPNIAFRCCRERPLRYRIVGGGLEDQD